MSNDKYPMSNKYDIHERIFIYVVSVLNFINELPRTPTNLIIIGQITRSVTSIGANDQEADGSSTTKDFLHCYTIVRKEGKETVYWLRIISETNIAQFKGKSNDFAQEGNEIVAIVSSIIMKTAQRIPRKTSLDI